MFFRSILWYWNSASQYTRQGFLKAQKTFQDPFVEENDKIVILTGANSGIGLSSALFLSSKNVDLHIICRNGERGNDALKKCQAISNCPEKIHLYIVDVSLPSDVSRFVKEFSKNATRCDVLLLWINNAGCMVAPRKETVDGIELNFATNTLGSYCMTKLMLPLLSSSKSPRVITVSSGGMYTSDFTIKDLQSRNSFNEVTAYASQKRHQVELTSYWAQNYPNIKFFSMHPGWVDTPGVQTSLPTFYSFMKSSLRTEEQGADTINWLSLSSKAGEQKSGSFFQDRVAVSPYLYGTAQPKAESINELIKICDDLIEKFLNKKY